MALAQWTQAIVSVNRVEKFLKLSEVKNDKSIYNRSDESMTKGAVKVTNATIFWRDPDTPIDDTDDSSHDSASISGSNHSLSKKDKKVSNMSNTNADDSEEVQELKYPQSILNDVNFSVAAGDLVAIIGRVGSGEISERYFRSILVFMTMHSDFFLTSHVHCSMLSSVQANPLLHQLYSTKL